MTSSPSPPSPPNRRLRRIVVTIAVLLVAGLVDWWYWPRGDARFVGKWSYAVLGDTGSFELWANGSGVQDDTDFGAWSVQGNRFVFGSGREYPSRFRQLMHLQLLNWTGKTFALCEGVFDVAQTETDRIVLRTPGDGVEWILTRIPE